MPHGEFFVISLGGFSSFAKVVEQLRPQVEIIECYLWGVAFHFEPQYSFVRIAVAKNMQMVSVMDDTYDNYATLDEAQLFTDVLQR